MASPGPESEGGKDAAEDHLRSIFDLCDEDGDGLVAVADLRRREEMCGYDKQMDLLLQTLDPAGQGRVCFDAFSAGIKSFLFAKALQKDDSVDSTTSEPLLNMSVEDTDAAFSSDELQSSSAQPDTSHALRYALVTVGEEDGESSDSSDGRPQCALQSTPFHSISAGSLSAGRDRDSPLMLRHTSAYELGDGRRHRPLERLPLDVPLEMESSLHSQVDELTSRLDCVEEEKRSSLSRQRMLEGDVRMLRERMFWLEDQLSEAQCALERERQEQDRRRAEELRRSRQETAGELEALRHSVAELGAERDALRHSEAELGRRLESAREDASGKGRLVVELESQLARLERQMSDEREVWRRAELTSERERVALQQALSESSQNQWGVEMESEAVSKRRSTVSLDLDLTREIDHLNKELNVLKEDNARLTACLLQQGKALASPLHNSSLASELELVSHEKLVGKLRESEQHCGRLRLYIESLLANVMDKHPELLEIQPT